MSWKQLLAARKVHAHKTSRQELDELRAVIQRDLSDAAIPALSEDRRWERDHIRSARDMKFQNGSCDHRGFGRSLG